MYQVRELPDEYKMPAIQWLAEQMSGFGKVYYVFISDITESRSILEEKERNKMLTEALKKEKKVSAAKTAFLTNMSHEIRTPINTILGMDEMII